MRIINRDRHVEFQSLTVRSFSLVCDATIAHLPAAILKCAAVSREINFSSSEEITQFRLEQRVFLDGSCIEEWLFAFGYVIPGSTNTWQQTIEAAGPENMLDPKTISGKLTIETAFYDGQLPIAKTVYRIFYV